MIVRQTSSGRDMETVTNVERYRWSSGSIIIHFDTVLSLLLLICMASGSVGDMVIDGRWNHQSAVNNSSSGLEPSFTHQYPSSPDLQPLEPSSTAPTNLLVSKITSESLSSQFDDVTFDHSQASIFKLGEYTQELDGVVLSQPHVVSMPGAVSSVASSSKPSRECRNVDLTSLIQALPVRASLAASDLTSSEVTSSKSTSSGSLDSVLNSKLESVHSDSGRVASVRIVPSPVLRMSANASLFHDVTEFRTSEATDILRLKIQVGHEVKVRSFQFVQMMKIALEQLYETALDNQRGSKTERRQKRQAQPQVTAQVLGVGRNASAAGGSDQVWVDFTLAQNGHPVSADGALSALTNLTTGQVNGIITHPIQGLSKEKLSVNNTLTVGEPSAVDLTVVTTGILIIATRASTTSTSTSSSSSSSSLTSQSIEVSMSSTKISSTGSSVPSSPSSSTTTTPPSSSQIPTDALRDALLSVDLDLKHIEKEQDSNFRRNFEKGIVQAYLEALQARRKRDVPNSDVIIHVRRHGRYLRQAGPEIKAQVTQVQKNTADPQVTNVTFYVMEKGQLVPASTATVHLNKLTDNALSAILGYPVVSRVQPVDRPNTPPTQPDDTDNDKQLFLVIIILPSVLLLLLVITLMATLIHACCYPVHPPPETHRAVATKYQRGDSVSDYSQNLEMERGQVMELTPMHSRTPTPDYLPHSQRYSKTSSTDSARHREESQWSQSDHHHHHHHLHHRDSRVDSVESVHHEYYNNGYLETSFSTSRADPARHQSRVEEESLAKNGDSEERSATYTQRKAPQARPRSFIRKLQSLKQGHRQYSPEQEMTALGDSAYISMEKPKPRDSSKGREQKSRDGKSTTQPTDASDEFTVMMPKFLANRYSRERPSSSNSPHPDLSEGERPRNPTSQQESTDDSQMKSSPKRDIPTEDDSLQKEETDIPPEHSSNQPSSREGKRRKSAPLVDSDQSLCTSQTQTSLTSCSDVSMGGEKRGVRRKSVGVGPDNINKKTQTTLPHESRGQKIKRKPRKQSSFGYKHRPGGNVSDEQKESEQQQQQQHQEEVMAYVRRHLAAHPPPHLSTSPPSIFTTPPTSPSTPTITSTTAPPDSSRQILEKLLNEACILTPPRHPGSASRDLSTSRPVQNGYGGDELPVRAGVGHNHGPPALYSQPLGGQFFARRW